MQQGAPNSATDANRFSFGEQQFLKPQNEHLRPSKPALSCVRVGFGEQPFLHDQADNLRTFAELGPASLSRLAMRFPPRCSEGMRGTLLIFESISFLEP